MSIDSWRRLWQPYIDTAISAWDRGEKIRAEKIVTLLVQVLRQSQKYNNIDENLVRGLYLVADHYCSEHEYWRAESIYLAVLETQEEILSADDPTVIETLIRLSTVVRSVGAGSEASAADDLPPAC